MITCDIKVWLPQCQRSQHGTPVRIAGSVAVIPVVPTGKAYFVYSYMQMRLKLLITPIRAVALN